MKYTGWPYYGRRYQELDIEDHKLRQLRDLYYDRYTIDSEAGRESAHYWMQLADETNSKLLAIGEMMRAEVEAYEKRRWIIND